MNNLYDTKKDNSRKSFFKTKYCPFQLHTLKLPIAISILC